VSVRTRKKSRYSSPESPPRRLFIYSPTRRDGSVRENLPAPFPLAASLPASPCVRDFPGGKRCLSDSGRNSREISPRKFFADTLWTIAIVVSSNLPIGIPSSTAMAAAAACTGGSKSSRGGKKGVEERGRAEAEETACR